LAIDGLLDVSAEISLIHRLLLPPHLHILSLILSVLVVPLRLGIVLHALGGGKLGFGAVSVYLGHLQLNPLKGVIDLDRSLGLEED
jgi:hypothetical protein